jgi:hypothetical protein
MIAINRMSRYYLCDFHSWYEPARLGVDKLAVSKSQGRPASLMSVLLLLPLSQLARNLLTWGGTKISANLGFLRSRGRTKTKTVIIHEPRFRLGVRLTLSIKFSTLNKHRHISSLFNYVSCVFYVFFGLLKKNKTSVAAVATTPTFPAALTADNMSRPDAVPAEEYE